MAEHLKFWKSNYQKYVGAAQDKVERLSDRNWNVRLKRMKAKGNLYLKVNKM